MTEELAPYIPMPRRKAMVEERIGETIRSYVQHPDREGWTYSEMARDLSQRSSCRVDTCMVQQWVRAEGGRQVRVYRYPSAEAVSDAA